MDIQLLKEQKEELQNQLIELKEGLGENDVFSDEQLQQWDAINENIVELNTKIETGERLLSFSVPATEKKDKPTVSLSSKLPVDEADVFRGWCLSQVNRKEFVTPKMIEMANRGNVRFDAPLTGSVSWTQTKAVAGNGGLAVNDAVVAGVINKLKSYGGMISTCHVFNTTSGENIKKIVHDSTGAAASKTAELGTIVNQTQAISSVGFKSTELTSACYEISMQLARDSAYDIVGEFQSFVAESFGRTINDLLTNGDGTDEPQGIADAVSTAFTPAAISYEAILDLFHSVDSAYRSSEKCAFMVSDATLLSIKKAMIDADGRPMFNTSVNNNVVVPAAMMLEGKPVVVNNDLASGTVLFGDFSRYHIRMVGSMTLRILNELFALKNAIGIVGHQAVDGRLVDNTAIKKLVVTGV